MLPVSARLRVKALNEYAVDAQSKLEYKPHTTIEFRESLKFLDKTQEHVGAFKSFPFHCTRDIHILLNLLWYLF